MVSEKAMAPHSSTLAWRILWTEEPGGLLSMGLHRVRHDWSDLACMHALAKEMATHSSILAWRIPGTEEPGGLPSLGSHRVGHDWSDLAAVAARGLCVLPVHLSSLLSQPLATTDLFIIFIVLSFPECHRVEIIDVAFLDWPFQLIIRI